MTAETARAALARAIADRPVVIPGTEPHEWYVQSGSAPGMFYRVTPAGCDHLRDILGDDAPLCTSCKHYCLAGAIERGIVDPATWIVA